MADTWTDGIRQMIREDVGRGWRVQEHEGMVRIFLAREGNKRSSVVTDRMWGSSRTELVNLMIGLRDLVNRPRNPLELAEAYA